MDLVLNNLQRLICHKTQQTNQNIYGERDEMINRVSKCSKLAQKEYKTIHVWVG